MARFLSLFILLPVLELVLLVQMGRWVGLLPTLGLVVATGFLGAHLIRREGVRAMAEFQGELARGQVPARPLMAGAALLVGGALLLTPGVVTDLAGFALLLPPTRSVIISFLKRRFEQSLAKGTIRMHVAGSHWGPTGPSGPAAGSGTSDSADLNPPRPRPGEIIQE